MNELRLNFCPRCKDEFTGQMERTIKGVVFCYLCSFDIEDEKDWQWIQWAKDRFKEMGDGKVITYKPESKEPGASER